MRISDYIEQLQALGDEHGDLEVELINLDLTRVTARAPVVSFRKILKGRESKPRFWSSYDGEDARGEPVIRV